MGSTKCSAASATYLKLLNVLLLLISFAIIGYSSYLISQANELDFKQALETSPFIIPLVVGLVLLIVSVFGICSAKPSQSKIILLIYLILVLLITIFVLACGVALLVYSNSLADIKSNQAKETLELNLQDFELAVYQKCCVEAFPGTTTAPETCAATTDPVCVNNLDRFNKIADAIPDRVCKALAEVDVVSDPAVDQGCGNGTAAGFVTEISNYLEDNIRPIGAANVVLAVLMMIDLIATCVLLWSGGKQSQSQEGDDGYRKSKKDNKAGPELAMGA